MSELNEEPKNILVQHWQPVFDETGVRLVGEDGTEILRLLRPDRGSDVFVAGYICALQAMHINKRGRR